MQTRDAILKRRSIRKYKDTPIPKELILELLNAADAAPSACNRRPLKFYVIRNKDILRALGESGRFTSFPAPLSIVVAGDMTKTLPRSFADYWVHDAGAATENILLMATDLGLGACWCGVHLQPDAMERVRSLLSLPENIIPFSLIKIGYPDEEREAHGEYDPMHVEFVD